MSLTEDLAVRITRDERTYAKLAAECWNAFDVTNAVRYRGMAEGFAMAREHLLAVVAEQKATSDVSLMLCPSCTDLAMKITGVVYECGHCATKSEVQPWPKPIE